MRLFHRVNSFELINQSEQKVSLTDFPGKYIVLYFYPKANTPGCTREAVDFTARLKEFKKLKAVVLGVSPDKPGALSKFIDSKHLDITLLSDPDKSLARSFGALNEKGGILRSTFILDKARVLRWQWKKVKVDGHVDKVLDVLKDLHDGDHEINAFVQQRRARRAIGGDVKKKDLQRLIEAASLAPSCFNRQPWRFVVVNGGQLSKLHGALPAGNNWAKRAPAIIAVVSSRESDCTLSHDRDYFLFDTGLAVSNLLLQATQQGLIAHPMAGFAPDVASKALSIPDDHLLIALVAVGEHSDSDSLNDDLLKMEHGPRERVALDKILSWGEFKL